MRNAKPLAGPSGPAGRFHLRWDQPKQSLGVKVKAVRRVTMTTTMTKLQNATKNAGPRGPAILVTFFYTYNVTKNELHRPIPSVTENVTKTPPRTNRTEPTE